MSKITKQQLVPIQKLIQDSFNVMDSFEELLAKETKLLKAAKFSEAEKLRNTKKEIASNYHRHVQMLLSRKEEIAQLPKEIKDTIFKKRQKFSASLDENMKTIESVRQASQRLIDKIIETARDAVKKEQTYLANGKTNNHTDNNRTSPISISVNETL